MNKPPASAVKQNPAADRANLRRMRRLQTTPGSVVCRAWMG